jgi:hypothetical protein
MKKTRKTTLIALTMLAVATLTGCSAHYTTEEAFNTPNTVIELTHDFWKGSTFGYVDSNTTVIPLVNCENPIFQKRYCESEDGAYRFQWSSSKYSRYVNESVIVNGEQIDLNCATPKNDEWSGDYICSPTSD